VEVSVSRVGVLVIGSGVMVRVPIGDGLAAGVVSVAVGLQETSRMLNKIKVEIFGTEPSALITVCSAL
jgi:hypothetical protein